MISRDCFTEFKAMQSLLFIFESEAKREFSDVLLCYAKGPGSDELRASLVYKTEL